ncbi:MAG TPA: acylphosphatase [Methylocella sp.]|nr:acylphosphatase [Methylocella sp.]
MMEAKTVLVRISGFVQGVGFRAWTEREARARGLRGWVRNRLNGDVEALFAGQAEDVEAMCAACWHGPQAARVEKVEISECGEDPRDLPGIGASFRQLATR